jgi:hypothetical protein
MGINSKSNIDLSINKFILKTSVYLDTLFVKLLLNKR